MPMRASGAEKNIKKALLKHGMAGRMMRGGVTGGLVAENMLRDGHVGLLLSRTP